MIEIILLIVGIVHTVRRPRLQKLTPGDFPGVDVAKFFEWQQAELLASDIYLCATWGAAFIKIALFSILAQIELADDEFLLAFFGWWVVWLGGLTVAAIYGSKAKRLRNALTACREKPRCKEKSDQEEEAHKLQENLFRQLEAWEQGQRRVSRLTFTPTKAHFADLCYDRREVRAPGNNKRRLSPGDCPPILWLTDHDGCCRESTETKIRAAGSPRSDADDKEGGREPLLRRARQLSHEPDDANCVKAASAHITDERQGDIISAQTVAGANCPS